MADDFSGDGSKGAGEVDLFGAPVGQIRERWGRPSFAKSLENQRLVAALRANGWSQGRIARYIGCDEKTLRKNFSRELEDGSDIIEGMAIEVTLQKMRQGHSRSVDRMLEMIDTKGRPAVPVSSKSSEKDEPLGKKAAADRDAKTAHEGTGWGSLLPH